MIFNPVIKKSGGGKMSEWEKLEIGGSQDVPMPLAGDPTLSASFELNFEQLPRIILFKTPYSSEYQYSALYLEDGNLAPPMTSYSGIGPYNTSVVGTKITGNVRFTNSDDIWFRPVYI